MDEKTKGFLALMTAVFIVVSLFTISYLRPFASSTKGTYSLDVAVKEMADLKPTATSTPTPTPTPTPKPTPTPTPSPSPTPTVLQVPPSPSPVSSPSPSPSPTLQPCPTEFMFCLLEKDAAYGCSKMSGSPVCSVGDFGPKYCYRCNT